MQAKYSSIARQLVDLMFLHTTEEDIDRIKNTHGYNGAEVFSDRWQNLPGFEYLGGGHFSAVFSSHECPDIAFKISMKKEDSGMLYAAWCRDNAHLPHLPQILHLETYREFGVVVMPEYTSVYGDSMLPSGFKWQGRMWEVLAIGASSPYGTDCPVFPRLRETLIAIHDFFKGVATFDLHAGNYMYDLHLGSIIITDPVSFKKKEHVPNLQLGSPRALFRTQLSFAKGVGAVFGFKPEKPVRFVRNGEKDHLAQVHPKKDVQPARLLNRLMRRVVSACGC